MRKFPAQGISDAYHLTASVRYAIVVFMNAIAVPLLSTEELSGSRLLADALRLTTYRRYLV